LLGQMLIINAVTVQSCHGISIALPNDSSLAIARLERMLLSHVI